MEDIEAETEGEAEEDLEVEEVLIEAEVGVDSVEEDREALAEVGEEVLAGEDQADSDEMIEAEIRGDRIFQLQD